MKKMKFFAVAFTLTLSFSILVGCGNVAMPTNSKRQDVGAIKESSHLCAEVQGKTENQDLEKESIEFEVESKEEIVEEPKEPTKEELSIEEQKNEVEENAKESSTNAIQTSTNKEWISFEHMEFFVNEKTYELGKTTLRELIDDGVVFDDLNYAENNIKANYESEDFLIKLNSKKDWNAAISVGNFSDEVKTIADCPVCKICLFANNELEMDVNKVGFSFPLNPTIDDLKTQAGEPTNEKECLPDGSKNTINFRIEYKKDASTYLGTYGYTFDYCENELDYIEINYIP